MATPAERALWFPESARVKVQTWHVVKVNGKEVVACPTRQRAQWYADVIGPPDAKIEIIEREMRHYGP